MGDYLERETVVSILSEARFAGSYCDFRSLINEVKSLPAVAVPVAAPEFVPRLLRLIAMHDAFACLFWHSDLNYFGVNVNDVFAWGAADLEEVTAENVDELEQAFRDCATVCDTGEIYGPWLFAARRRKLRPQGASYPQEQELWPLFDTCGPERETGFGNPYKPGEYKPAARPTALSTSTIEAAAKEIVANLYARNEDEQTQRIVATILSRYFGGGGGE